MGRAASRIVVIGTGLLRKASIEAVEEPVTATVIIPESSVEMVQAAAELADEESSESNNGNNGVGPR